MEYGSQKKKSSNSKQTTYTMFQCNLESSALPRTSVGVSAGPHFRPTWYFVQQAGVQHLLLSREARLA